MSNILKFPKRKIYKHNNLFKPGKNSTYNACVGTNGGPYNDRAYAYGYCEASKLLFASLLKDPTYVDVIIYPLTFNIRHGIELNLKHLAKNLPLLWNKTPQVMPTHKLLDNWLLVKSYLKLDKRLIPKGAISMVDSYIKDFIEIDPNGEAFRFPMARNGSAFLQNMAWINIVVLAEETMEMFELFDYWSDSLEELLDEKAECESDD